MKIFLLGSIRGGRASQPEYARIASLLEKRGTLLSRHVSDAGLSEHGETHLLGREILERERESLANCDAVVAEVTEPSLGVGYLIALATAAKKKVVALYQGDDASMLSEIIKGDAGVIVRTYKTDQDLEAIFRETL